MRDKIENYKVHWGDIYRFSTASDGKTAMEKLSTILAFL